MSINDDEPQFELVDEDEDTRTFDEVEADRQDGTDRNDGE